MRYSLKLQVTERSYRLEKSKLNLEGKLEKKQAKKNERKAVRKNKEIHPFKMQS